MMNLRIGLRYLLLSLFLLFLILALVWTPYNPYHIQMSDRLQTPSALHWLGTDHLGRDLLSRIMEGARTTVGISLTIMLVSLLIGVPFGLLSGYIGGWLDKGFKKIIDAFMTLPDYIFALILSGLLGPGLVNLIFAITAVKWVSYARLVRSIVLEQRQKDYVHLAEISGMKPWTLVIKHILPHTIGNLLVLATLDIGKIILMIASLSYIGLGPQPPSPEWGAMLSEGRTYFQTAPHLMIFPGLCIVITVLLTNSWGDILRDRYDVHVQPVLSKRSVSSILSRKGV